MSRGQGSHMNWCLDCKVYVGDLGYGAAKQEIEDIFSQYGPLRNVWVARNPPGFAFVEYQDPRDAKDAVRGLNGIKINGRKVRVEMSTGESRWGKRGPPMGRRGYRDSRDSRVRNDRSSYRSLSVSFHEKVVAPCEPKTYRPSLFSHEQRLGVANLPRLLHASQSGFNSALLNIRPSVRPFVSSTHPPAATTTTTTTTTTTSLSTAPSLSSTTTNQRLYYIMLSLTSDSVGSAMSSRHR